jgi:hypothetical protein
MNLLLWSSRRKRISRAALACFYACAFNAILRAQAAVEYAAKSANSTFSNGGAGMHLGVCPLDSAVVPCVHKYYPVPFYVAIVVICFLFGKLLYPRRRF